MNNEITNKKYEKERIEYQFNRAKEYVKNNVSNNGSEPSLEWCIIKDLIKMIESLHEQNRELAKALVDHIELGVYEEKAHLSACRILEKCEEG